MTPLGKLFRENILSIFTLMGALLAWCCADMALSCWIGVSSLLAKFHHLLQTKNVTKFSKAEV